MASRDPDNSSCDESGIIGGISPLVPSAGSAILTDYPFAGNRFD